jgi:hypothetical protein
VRPNVSEQLDGIRHVLTEVIAPHVTDPYAANILGGLLGALGSLAAGWSFVPQFLLWDAAGTAAVLTAARPYLDEGLTGELDEALGYTLDGDIDLQALESHHRRVRALLERAVPAIVDQPAVRSLLLGHLRDRIARFPLSTVPPIRNPQTGGNRADAAR